MINNCALKSISNERKNKEKYDILDQKIIYSIEKANFEHNSNVDKI